MLTNAQKYGADGARALGLHPDIITVEDYRKIKDRLGRFDVWYASIGRPGSYHADNEPEDVRVTNDERSAVEVYEFVTVPPWRYFLYIAESAKDYTGPRRPISGGLGRATTWTGDNLGVVYFGDEYRSNFGDRRVPITVKAINGLTYHGTYYRDAGDYARVKAAKIQPKGRE